MKLGHIMCKTLCIYGSQVACCIFGGWGVSLYWEFPSIKVGSRSVL